MANNSLLIFLIILSCPCFSFPTKVMTLDEVFKPRMMLADSEKIYISDNNRLLIYNHRDKKNQPKIIGKKGEGPGEFKNSPSIQLIPEGIFLHSVNKYCIVNKDGLILEEKSMVGFGLPITKAGDNWIRYR